MFMSICPHCKSIFELSDASKSICPVCGNTTVWLGCTDEQWSDMDIDTKKALIDETCGKAVSSENDENTERYCYYCGKAIKKNTVICPHCGCKVIEEEEETDTSSGSNLNGPFITLILGIVGALYSMITISNDKSQWFGYNYEFPLTEHELFNVLLLIASGIAILIGAIQITSRKHTNQ